MLRSQWTDLKVEVEGRDFTWVKWIEDASEKKNKIKKNNATTPIEFNNWSTSN